MVSPSALFKYNIKEYKYKIGFKIQNCTEDILRVLEPWCDHVFVDYNFTNYIGCFYAFELH